MSILMFDCLTISHDIAQHSRLISNVFEKTSQHLLVQAKKISEQCFDVAKMWLHWFKSLICCPMFLKNCMKFLLLFFTKVVAEKPLPSQTMLIFYGLEYPMKTRNASYDCSDCTWVEQHCFGGRGWFSAFPSKKEKRRCILCKVRGFSKDFR